MFYSGGRGPVPKHVLASDSALEGVDALIASLPILCTAAEVREGYGSSSVVADCQKGIFCYDYADVHRTHGLTRSYEQIATPATALWLADISTVAQAQGRPIPVVHFRFDEASIIRPEALGDCVHPPRR